MGLVSNLSSTQVSSSGRTAYPSTVPGLVQNVWMLYSNFVIFPAGLGPTGRQKKAVVLDYK